MILLKAQDELHWFVNTDFCLILIHYGCSPLVHLLIQSSHWVAATAHYYLKNQTIFARSMFGPEISLLFHESSHCETNTALDLYKEKSHVRNKKLQFVLNGRKRARNAAGRQSFRREYECLHQMLWQCIQWLLRDFNQNHEKCINSIPLQILVCYLWSCPLKQYPFTCAFSSNFPQKCTMKQLSLWKRYIITKTGAGIEHIHVPNYQ